MPPPTPPEPRPAAAPDVAPELAPDRRAEIRYEVTDGVALVTLDAPARRNALTVAMAGDLVAAVDAADADPGVGAIVVTGGAHFCAGADRSVLAAAGEDPARDDHYRALGAVYEAFTRVGTAGVPTIAAVRGAAVGAGLNLALATDLRLVSHTARLLPGFARAGGRAGEPPPLGIHPGGGHFTLLHRAGGRETSAAMGLFGEEVDGDRAVALGMAWAAHDDDEVLGAALRLAGRIAGDPPLARRTVASFRRETAPGGLPWDVAVELERAPQMWSLRRRHDA